MASVVRIQKIILRKILKNTGNNDSFLKYVPIICQAYFLFKQIVWFLESKARNENSNRCCYL